MGARRDGVWETNIVITLDLKGCFQRKGRIAGHAGVTGRHDVVQGKYKV